ncbi:receptor-type protein kinase, putative [Bodo saltans]|uniref:Receptor-type protein kinase, putative n=1 Tax=Bodo saltans TaxID=75058 RepID=A0A0S4KHI6_BODSA|nr:receptor-type protein kinase, putative [Bodo saltans]|eukprot:CUI12957.1 receptor-type protein kinase, putative [Bodo saltans]
MCCASKHKRGRHASRSRITQQLHHLDISGSKRVTDGGMARLVSFQTSLRILSIEGCSNVTDIGIADVALLTRLESLSCNKCVKISDVGIAKLLPLQRLRHLSLEA